MRRWILNTQKPEKRDHDPSGALWVRDVFSTIQGEGPDIGTPAAFIRLAGCNLQCPWCDTDYTSTRAFRVVSDLVDQVKHESNFVVITGGEPFRQNIFPLVRSLVAAGLRVQVETNGTMHDCIPADFVDVSVVCSPKTSLIKLPWFRIEALKYPVKAGELAPDGLPRDLARMPQVSEMMTFLQPIDEKDERKNRENLEAAIESCVQHGYRLSVQLQKIIGLA